MRLLLAIPLFLTAICHGQINVAFQIDTDRDKKEISPYIYGTNLANEGTNLNWGSYRLGGNRLTGYNWENNMSNAGADYLHSSDNYLAWSNSSIPNDDHEVAGVVATVFHERSQSEGAYSIMTLQMGGYVSADGNGAVSNGEAAPSNRWMPVEYEKPGGNFSYPPDLNDGKVYMDEFVSYLVDELGDSRNGGIQGYSLDNEPGLWSGTHPRLHPGKAGAEEVFTEGAALAESIKNVDPNAEVYGPVFFGWGGMWDMNGAPDWSAVKGNNQEWYVDYYLKKMRDKSIAVGQRLLDVLDVHWYPEATGNNTRIVFNNSTTINADARMQAPRSLWDPTYRESSWVTDGFLFGPINLIPRLQESIDTYYPQTKLAFTEYDYGGGSHISGGIALADVLGIFGKTGVYAAHHWNTQNNVPYKAAAFKIFRNYDGNNGSFGPKSVYAFTSDRINSSCYAAVDDSPNTPVNLVVMNKSSDESIKGYFEITTSRSLESAKIYSFNSTSSTVQLSDELTDIEENGFIYTIPPLTVLHFILEDGAIGLAENAASSDLSFFPNPTKGNGTLTIDLPKATLSEIKIITTTGEVVWSDKGKYSVNGPTDIPIEFDLGKGYYLLEVNSNSGRRISNFVVE